MLFSVSGGGAEGLLTTLDLPAENRFLFFVGAKSSSESSGTIKSSVNQENMSVGWKISEMVSLTLFYDI